MSSADSSYGSLCSLGEGLTPSIPPGKAVLTRYWVQMVKSMLGRERMLRNGASGQAPHLDAMRDVVNNEYSPTVFVAWQGHVEPEHLHLPPRLRSSLLPIDGFAGRTLQTPILEKRVRQNEPSPSPQNSHVQMAGGRGQQGGLRHCRRPHCVQSPDPLRRQETGTWQENEGQVPT